MIRPSSTGGEPDGSKSGNRRICSVFAIVLLMFVGCASTPSIEGAPGISSSLGFIGEEVIVVSDCSYSTYFGPVPIEFLMPEDGHAAMAYNAIVAGYGSEIELVVARILMSIGVPAVARQNVTIEDLADNEILLTGELRFTQPYSDDLPQMLLMFLLMGNVFPTPLPYEEGGGNGLLV